MLFDFEYHCLLHKYRHFPFLYTCRQLGSMEDGDAESSSLIFVACGAAIVYILLVKSERSHPNVSILTRNDVFNSCVHSGSDSGFDPAQTYCICSQSRICSFFPGRSEGSFPRANFGAERI